MSKQPPEGSTYYDRAVADEWLLGRRRFKDEVPAQVPAVPAYPPQPTSSPWHSDPVPAEPPLRYRIDQLTPEAGDGQ